MSGARLATRLIGSALSSLERQQWVVRSLAVQPGERVLTTMCGPGSELAFLLSRGAKVVVVSRSLLDHVSAYRRHRAAVLLNRLELHHGQLDGLGKLNRTFHKVLSTDTLDHDRGQADAIRQSSTMLAPGGLLAVRIGRLSNRDLSFRAAEDIRLRMIASGLIETRVEYMPLRIGSTACVLARKLLSEQADNRIGA